MGSNFREQLTELLNKFSRENQSDTPDYILAEFIHDSLDAFDKATRRRTQHYKGNWERAQSLSTEKIN